MSLFGRYESGYKEPRSIEEQVHVLKKYFPDIDYTIESVPNCSKGAEGLFVIPKWWKIASARGDATTKVINILEDLYDEIRTIEELKDFRQSIKTEKALGFIGKKQLSDVFVVPAQFGMRLKGSSIKSARKKMYVNEFGMGLYETGIMLITHPERLQDYNDLRLYCVGDEIFNGTGFECSSIIYIYNGLNIVHWHERLPGRYSGAVTGFLQDRFNILNHC